MRSTRTALAPLWPLGICTNAVELDWGNRRKPSSHPCTNRLGCVLLRRTLLAPKVVKDFYLVSVQKGRATGKLLLITS
jgi:hypothetical protein